MGMKITSVEIYDMNTEGLRVLWHPVVIKINTDAGLTGVGEVALAYGVGHSAGAGMVKNLAETFLLGADPLQIEKIWETMLRGSFWGLGGGPAVYGGMSAIDMALWDIKGQALGQPIWQLLGGQTNPKLRCYASQIQFGWVKDKITDLTQPEQYAEAAAAAIAEGYDCVKVDPIMLDLEGTRNLKLRGVLDPKTLEIGYQRVKAVRESVGPDIDIIIELHSMMSVTTSIQLGKRLEEFNCALYEEPVHYLNPELMKKVADNVNIPMAGGERIYTRWGFAPYLRDQSLSVIQPDLGLVGGITEGKKICDLAHVYDATVQCHVCGGPIGTVAALHLETIIPNFYIHEHHTYALKPTNVEICIEDFQPQNGYFTAPNEPGLGVHLNDEVIKRSPHVTVS